MMSRPIQSLALQSNSKGSSRFIAILSGVVTFVLQRLLDQRLHIFPIAVVYAQRLEYTQQCSGVESCKLNILAEDGCAD